jgi:hypothetical protein
LLDRHTINDFPTSDQSLFWGSLDILLC